MSFKISLLPVLLAFSFASGLGVYKLAHASPCTNACYTVWQQCLTTHPAQYCTDAYDVCIALCDEG